MSVLDTDTTRPADVILSDIREAATSQMQPGLALLPFATLLVKLSQESSETADKNIRIQKRMIWLTIIILLISLAQLGLVFFQQFSVKPKSVISAPESINTGTKTGNSNQNNNPIHK